MTEPDVVDVPAEGRRGRERAQRADPHGVAQRAVPGDQTPGVARADRRGRSRHGDRPDPREGLAERSARPDGHRGGARHQPGGAAGDNAVGGQPRAVGRPARAVPHPVRHSTGQLFAAPSGRHRRRRGAGDVPRGRRIPGLPVAWRHLGHEQRLRNRERHHQRHAFEPDNTKRSGGPGSLVSWDSLGRQGRDFTGRGSTVADLEKFDADRTAPTAHERAEMAVKELDRTGAFDRKVLAVFGATGTGWINPRVASSLEYLHGGNTAEVSIQYSFLPSWLSFLVDQNVASEAGRELFSAVRSRLDQIPEAKRPKLLLFGESLGSYATEAAFTDISDLQAHSDGALLVGPTFSNDIWTELTRTRVAGSPEWRPKVRQPAVRFAGTPADLEGFRDETGSRVVYLQNSSDPITWFSGDLAYRKPDWAGDPAAPDRSSAFTWMPLVTFWQVVADLADSLGVPTGFGHHFGSNVVDGWVAISAPESWTPADTTRLKAVVGERG